jgi:hypothetical protein
MCDVDKTGGSRNAAPGNRAMKLSLGGLLSGLGRRFG